MFCFHSHFQANFHAFITLLFSFILESFCSFLNREGANIRPQIRPRKIPAQCYIQGSGHQHLGSREDFCKVFTIYGYGNYLGHVTRTTCINFHFSTLRSLLMKIEFNWPKAVPYLVRVFTQLKYEKAQ